VITEEKLTITHFNNHKLKQETFSDGGTLDMKLVRLSILTKI